MDIKLSFILPVYNVEMYLEQCVNSILSQITPACEIILVNDGSPDGCGAICDRYAAENAAVKVIHKANGGLSDARNTGLRLATGEYVLFVDSDDYIEPGSVEKLLAWLGQTSCDIGFLPCNKVYPDGTLEPMGDGLIRENIFGKPRDKVMEFLSACPKFPASACTKIYRRRFLEDNDLHFPADRRLSEDLSFSLDVLLKAEGMDVLDFPYYCYRKIREGSITNTVSKKSYFDNALFVKETVERYVTGKMTDDAGIKCALSFAAYEYTILIWHLLYIKGEDRTRALRFLKEYRWVLNWGNSRKTKFVKTVVNLCGLMPTAIVMDVYMRNR